MCRSGSGVRTRTADGPVGIMTGYEEKFYALGTPIHRCELILYPREAPQETEEPHGNTNSAD